MTSPITSTSDADVIVALNLATDALATARQLAMPGAAEAAGALIHRAFEGGVSADIDERLAVDIAYARGAAAWIVTEGIGVPWGPELHRRCDRLATVLDEIRAGFRPATAKPHVTRDLLLYWDPPLPLPSGDLVLYPPLPWPSAWGQVDRPEQSGNPPPASVSRDTQKTQADSAQLDALRTPAEAAREPTRTSTAPRAPVPERVTRYVMARDLAGTVFPVSEDSILREARKHGIGRKMGRVIIFSPDDIQHLYEVLPCPSNSSAAASRPTGSSAALSGASALKRLQELLTDESPKKSERRARAKSLHSQSTVVALPARSRKRR
jgi:hypothetical protein